MSGGFADPQEATLIGCEHFGVGATTQASGTILGPDGDWPDPMR